MKWVYLSTLDSQETNGKKKKKGFCLRVQYYQVSELEYQPRSAPNHIIINVRTRIRTQV